MPQQSESKSLSGSGSNYKFENTGSDFDTDPDRDMDDGTCHQKVCVLLSFKIVIESRLNSQTLHTSDP